LHQHLFPFRHRIFLPPTISNGPGLVPILLRCAGHGDRSHVRIEMNNAPGVQGSRRPPEHLQVTGHAARTGKIMGKLRPLQHRRVVTCPSTKHKLLENQIFAGHLLVECFLLPHGLEHVLLKIHQALPTAQTYPVHSFAPSILAGSLCSVIAPVLTVLIPAPSHRVEK
jgi:hypothetical protein